MLYGEAQDLAADIFVHIHGILAIFKKVLMASTVLCDGGDVFAMMCSSTYCRN
jgi:hypothetical protein